MFTNNRWWKWMSQMAVHVADRPVPLVWSPAGPVLTVSVGPLFLSQWNSPVPPGTHLHRSSSKEQPTVDRAGAQKGQYDLTWFTFSSLICEGFQQVVVLIVSNNSNKPVTILLLTFISQMTDNTASALNWIYFDLLSKFKVTQKCSSLKQISNFTFYIQIKKPYRNCEEMLFVHLIE